jgi:NADH dehydrogenase
VNLQISAVTGAFGYSGRYIAQRLLSAGNQVITLTNSVVKHDPFDGSVRRYPLQFKSIEKLRDSLAGVTALYNTYWVRFNHKSFTYAQAVSNTRVLFAAAREAGVERIIHVSITNPSLDSPLEYFRGKAEIELALEESGTSYAILRPTVLFGNEDILINNIAWMLRRFPVFGVPGDGHYRLQPIYVDDLARLAIRHGAHADNVTIDTIGPETFTYRELVTTIGRAIGHVRPIKSLSPAAAYSMGLAVGRLVRDVVITRDEIRGLMDGLLYVESEPAGATALTDWVSEHSSELGVKYTSELARRNLRAI